MNKAWRILAGMLLLVVSGVTVAGQSATWTCVEWNNNGDDPVCVKYELKVRITTDQDAGRPGAFGVGAQLGDGQLVQWTVARGFEAYTAAMAEPSDGYYAALPAVKEFVVYRGTARELCTLSGGLGFTLYAAHGILTPEKEAQVNQLLAGHTNNPNVVSTDHFKRVFIQNDVRQNTNKYGEVFSRKCSTGQGSAN